MATGINIVVFFQQYSLFRKTLDLEQFNVKTLN